MGRFQRSIEIAKASWHTLKADRELLVLPVLSFVFQLIALGLAIGLVFLIDYDAATGFSEFELSGGGVAVLVVAGMLLAVITTFFQAAMVGGARERITGGDPTVTSAIAVAWSRIGVVVPWALFSWTVGTILRAIEERAGVVGRIVVGLIGMAFRVVTFLAVPVLVVERLGPINTLKRSGELFRLTWGENLIAQVGLGLVGLVLVLPVVILAAAIGAALNVFAAVVIAVPLLGAIAVVMTSLTAVYQTALYHYVTTHEIPTNFESADLGGAFTPR